MFPSNDDDLQREIDELRSKIGSGIHSQTDARRFNALMARAARRGLIPMQNETTQQITGALNNVSRANAPAVGITGNVAANLPQGGQVLNTGSGRPSSARPFTPAFVGDAGEVDWASFAAYMRTTLKNIPGVNPQIDTLAYPEAGFLEVAVRVPGQAQPLIRRYAPGPLDPHGNPTLIKPFSTGYFHGIGGQIFAESPTSQKLTASGYETLAEQIRIAATNKPLQRQAGGWVEAFELMEWTGSEDFGIAGRNLNFSPQSPTNAILQGLSSVSIVYGGNVTDLRSVDRAIQQRISTSASMVSRLGWLGIPSMERTPEQQEAIRWANLAGYVPIKQDKDIMERWYQLYDPSVSESGEVQVTGFGKNLSSPIKRRTIYEGRHPARMYTYQTGTDAGGRPITTLKLAEAQPTVGTSWGGTAGLRLGTMREYGETARKEYIVTPGTVMLPEELPGAAGALLSYRNPFTANRQPIVAGSFQTSQKIEMPDLSMSELANAKFELGLMKPIYDAEGKIVDYEKTQELEGAFLPAMRTHTIGYYQIGEGTKTPLTVQTGGSAWAINRVLGLDISAFHRGYKPTPYFGSPAEAPPESSRDIAELIRRANPGLNVSAVGAGGPAELFLSVGEITDTSLKNQGVKLYPAMVPQYEVGGIRSDLPLSRRQFQSVNPQVQLRGSRGIETRNVAAVTGSVKDLTQQFMASFITRDPNIQAQWVGELAQLEPEIPGMAGLATALQGYLTENIVGGLSEASPERMAELYAQHIYGKSGSGYRFSQGENYYTGRNLFTELMARLEYTTEYKLEPTSAYQQYGWARIGEQEFEAYPVSKGERAMLTRSAIGAAAMHMQNISNAIRSGNVPKGYEEIARQFPEGLPQLLSDRGSINREALSAFRSVFPRGLRDMVNITRTGEASAPYLYRIKTPENTIFGNMAVTPVSEWRGGLSGLGLAEVRGLEAEYPGVSRFLGMQTEKGPQGVVETGYGISPRQVEAYRQMSDIVAYRRSEMKPPGRPAYPGRVITPEQASDLIAEIEGGALGEDWDKLTAQSERLQQLIGDVPLVMPQSVSDPRRRGAAIVPPKTVANLSYSKFPIESEYGNEVTEMGKLYVDYLLDSLREAAGGVQGGKSKRFEHLMTRQFASGAQTLKSLERFWSEGVLSARYSFGMGMGLQTNQVPEETIERFLNAATVGGNFQSPQELAAWKTAARAQINQMGLPQAGTREPFQPPGWMMLKGMTTAMLAQQRGLRLPAPSGSRGRQFMPGIPFGVSGLGAMPMSFATGGRGDFDADLAMQMFLAKRNPAFKPGGAEPALLYSQDWLEKTGQPDARIVQEVSAALRTSLGTSAGFEGGVKHETASSLLDYYQVIDPLARSGAPSGIPTGTATGPYSEAVQKAIIQKASGKEGMGAEYTFLRAIGSAAGALGLGNVPRTAGGMHYQTVLDIGTEVYGALGGTSILQSILNSATWAEENGQAKLIYKPSPTAKFTTLLNEGVGGSARFGALATAVQTDYETYLDVMGQKMPKEWIGGLWAQRSEDVEWIGNKFEETWNANPDLAMSRTLGAYQSYLGEQGVQYDPYGAPLPLAVVSSAYQRISRFRAGQKPPRQIRNKEGKLVPTYQAIGPRLVGIGPGGSEVTLMEGEKLPTVRASMILQQIESRQGVPNVEDVAFLGQYARQLAAAGKVVPETAKSYLASTAGMRAEEQVTAARQAGITNVSPQVMAGRVRNAMVNPLMVTASQMGKLAGVGLPEEWTNSAYQMLLARNIKWGSRGQLPESEIERMFKIDSGLADIGSEFESAALTYAKREYGLQNVVSGIPRTTTPIPLHEFLSQEEMAFMPEGMRMVERFTPDLIATMGTGANMQAVIGEMKAGESQTISGQVQLFNSYFALSRLAGWDPLTNKPWAGASAGGEARFRQIMGQYMQGGNAAYKAASPEQQAGMVNQMLGLFGTGAAQMMMFTGAGGMINPMMIGQTAQGDALSINALYKFSQQAWKNAATRSQNPELIQQDLAGLAKTALAAGVDLTPEMQEAWESTVDVSRPGFKMEEVGGDTEIAGIPTKQFATKAGRRRLAAGLIRSGGQQGGPPRRRPPVAEGTGQESDDPKRLRIWDRDMQLTGFVESPGIFGGGGEGGGTLEHIIKIMGGSSREDDASKLWKLEEWRATLGLIEQTGGAEFATRFAQQAGMGRSTSPAIDIRSVPFNQLAAAMSSSGLETMEQLAKLRKYSSQLAGHFPDIKSAQAQIASLRQIGAFLQPYEEALMLNIAGYATAIPVGAATQGHKGLADISYGAQLSGLLMGANKEFGLVNPRTGMPKFMEERWKALDEKTSIDIQDITAKYRAEAADAIEASGKKPNALIEKYHGTMAGLKAADEILSTKMKNLFTKLEESGFSEAGELQRESKLGTTEVDRTMLRKGADTIRRLAEARYKAMPTPVNKELLGAATELAESGWEYSQKPKEMEQTQAAFEGEGVGGGRFGTLARRLFSGFGLMYIRSIFGLMGTGAYTGYGERMQLEATMAQQLLGVGGQMPITPTSELERVQAIQYGGQGGLALKSAQAAFMREQQPFYNLFTSGLAGVSGGGMAMWLMQTGWPELGKQVTNRVGVGVGAAITAGSAALNIYGASQDVQGSAMNIAVRQAAGENISRNAILSVLLGTGIGAGGGALIGGGVPGALIGGGIGLISGIGANAQFIASGLNPEIARQTEILQALAGRGQVPIQSILGNYGVAPTQYAYYAQQAAMVQSSQVGNLGISPEAWGATAAYELRRNTSLGDYWRQRFAAAAQSGFNAETYGVMATQLLGMPVLEAQGGPQNAPTQTSYTSTPIPYNLLENPNAAIGNAVLGAVNWLSGGVVENKYAQKPISYQTGGVSSGTQISPIAQWSNAILRWSATQPSPDIAKERIESAFGALGEMGVYGAEYLQKNVIGQPATISEARRRMLEQREYEVAGGGQKAISELQTDVEFEKTLQYSERLAALKSRGWLAPYQAQLQLQTLQKSLGLPEIQVPELAVWETKAVNPLEQYQMQLATTRQTLITSAPEQQITAQYQFGGQFAQTLMQGGVSTENAINVGNILATMTPEKFAQYQGLLSLNPLGTAAWAMSNQQGALELMQRGSVPGMGGTTIPTANFGLADINAGGLTGLPWGTTSMAKPMEVAAMMRQGLPMAVAVATSANNMGAVLWGRGYQQRTDINQGLAQALLTGGQFGAQAYQQIQMAGFQMASAGVQLQQIALQREYQPQFWALEDRSRALGYAQTEWGFGQQQAQLNMQQRFWQQNFGLNVQQAQMQRGWTQQDWGYQTNVRNMQWQWQQEDFAEQARFMTGRDRRLAERQMGRATIMHDLEGEQIDKQRSRQKELWALEDERFRIARAQNQEQLQFQQQAIEKQRSFYEERKAIEEEQVRLQREYWEKNMDLQEKAAGISAAAAAAQIENARTMLEATQNIQAESAKPGLANPVTMGTLAETLTELNPLMLTFIENIGKVKGALQGIGTGAGNDVIWTTVEEAMKTEIGRQEYSEGRDINGNGIIGRAIGGPSLGQLSLIGEAGPELLKLPIASSVFPNGILKASEYGMTSFADPWQNPSVFATPQFSHSEKQAINIYLGNELLGTWVVDKVNHEIGV